MEVDHLEGSLGGTRVFLIVSCDTVKEASKLQRDLRKFLRKFRG